MSHAGLSCLMSFMAPSVTLCSSTKMGIFLITGDPTGTCIWVSILKRRTCNANLLDLRGNLWNLQHKKILQRVNVEVNAVLITGVRASLGGWRRELKPPVGDRGHRFSCEPSQPNNQPHHFLLLGSAHLRSPDCSSLFFFLLWIDSFICAGYPVYGRLIETIFE